MLIVCERHEPSEREMTRNGLGDLTCLICLLEDFYEDKEIPTELCPKCGGVMQLGQGSCTRCKKRELD